MSDPDCVFPVYLQPRLVTILQMLLIWLVKMKNLKLMVSTKVGIIHMLLLVVLQETVQVLIHTCHVFFCYIY